MSLVGTRPILLDELQQYELHHRARIAINKKRAKSSTSEFFALFTYLFTCQRHNMDRHRIQESA